MLVVARPRSEVRRASKRIICSSPAREKLSLLDPILILWEVIGVRLRLSPDSLHKFVLEAPANEEGVLASARDFLSVSVFP